jgi:cystathionine beta-lyase
VKYDFESIMKRQGMDAIAVDSLGQGDPSFTPAHPEEGFDIIPMWVADMNFPTCPTIPQAMIARAQHPAYGYFDIRKEYYDEIIKWHKTRNNVTGLTKEQIGYENGVLGGVLSALAVVCSKGDNVLLHSPTYIGFTGSLKNNGYNIVLSPLQKDEGGTWRMDIRDMEEKIRDHHIHAAIFCSPHNPCGRVWSEQEILAFTELCRKYDVTIISDEIWSDLTLFGNRHVPTQSVSEDARQRTIALYAPSKTFNLAGLVGSYHIIYNDRLHERVLKESSLSHYNNINLLSMYALIGAYSPEGYEWLDELRSVLGQNIDYACRFIRENLPGLEVSRPEGTYMLFVDCSQYCREKGKTLDDVLAAAWRVGVAVQDGRPFHGPCHVRVNLALPLSRVKEAFDRLRKYVFV